MEDTLTTGRTGEGSVPDRFSDAVQMTTVAVGALSVIEAVETVEESHSAQKVAKAARDVVRRIEDRRKELKAPHLEAGRKIDAYAKELTDKVGVEIERVRGLIREHETRVAREREERQRRLEEERRRREEAEGRERERVDRLRRRLRDIEDEGMELVTRSTNADKLERLLDNIRERNLAEEFEEFGDEYHKIRTRILRAGRERLESLREIDRQRAEAERLAGEDRRQREEELRLRQEAERLRAAEQRAEAERLQRERDAQARAEMELREAEEAARERERQKKIEAEGSGALRRVWKWEVEDISEVPLEYLEVNRAAVTASVRENKDRISAGEFEIPGIRIYQEETVVLR